MHYKVMQGLEYNLQGIKNEARIAGIALVTKDADIVNTGIIDVLMLNYASNLEYFVQCLLNRGLVVNTQEIISLGNGYYRLLIRGYISLV